MARLQPLRLLALTLIGWAGCSVGAGALAGDLTSPGAKGAQVYCYMRNAGNSHEVSWAAAYALIKRQAGSMFRPSPEHSAVMITEAVVNNPGSFPDCGKYLGDLYTNTVNRQKQAAEGSSPGNATTTTGGTPATSTAPAVGPRDRYTY